MECARIIVRCTLSQELIDDAFSDTFTREVIGNIFDGEVRKVLSNPPANPDRTDADADVAAYWWEEQDRTLAVGLTVVLELLDVESYIDVLCRWVKRTVIHFFENQEALCA